METNTGEHMSSSDSVQDDRRILDQGGKEVWIADSRSSYYMTPSKEKMCDYEPRTGVSVTVANSHNVPIAHSCKLFVSTAINHLIRSSSGSR